MNEIAKEELLRLAELSQLKFSEEELAEINSELKQLLTYTEDIMNTPTTGGIDASRPINVFREDKAVAKDSSAILDQAPDQENNHFVVPNILDS